MKICLIGATHPSFNPRIIREADTLAQEGHEVRVVAPCFMSGHAESDKRLLSSRKWRLETADFRTGFWSIYVRGHRKLSRKIFDHIGWPSVHAYSSASRWLTKIAAAQSADWYIAHAHRALPIAAAAADQHRARLGFDCEDLLTQHEAEDPKLIRAIERKYIEQCAYVSVPSNAIADELSKEYGIQCQVLYNVFPLRLADALTPPAQRAHNKTLRLHWFSQTIGSGRGLEEAIEALRILDQNVELTLRGLWAAGYEEKLRALVSPKIKLTALPCVDHDDLISTMGVCDVGLALERPELGNASRTVSNKIGSYLLAGLAIVATDTIGQREIPCSFLYPPGRPDLLARQLQSWIINPDALRKAKQMSWDSARSRYCWDIESRRFLECVDSKRLCTPPNGPN